MGVSRGRGASAAPVFLPKQNQLPPSKMHLNNFAMKLVQVVLRMPCSLPPHCPFRDEIFSLTQSLQASTHTPLFHLHSEHLAFFTQLGRRLADIMATCANLHLSFSACHQLSCSALNFYPATYFR